jgi:hypothetical protein
VRKRKNNLPLSHALQDANQRGEKDDRRNNFITRRIGGVKIDKDDDGSRAASRGWKSGQLLGRFSELALWKCTNNSNDVVGVLLKTCFFYPVPLA